MESISFLCYIFALALLFKEKKKNNYLLIACLLKLNGDITVFFIVKRDTLTTFAIEIKKNNKQ